MNIIGNIRQWRRNRECQQILNNLPDRILEDIGLTRDGKRTSVTR